MAKARRAFRTRDDDAGVSEVVGFILSFAISALVLVASTQAFTRARENTDAMTAGVELRGVANRVAARAVQAGIVAQELPNATITFRIRVDPEFAGQGYRVEASDDAITATQTGGFIEGSATTYRLGDIPFVSVGGSAYSSSGWISLTYAYTRSIVGGPAASVDYTYPDAPANHVKSITITEG